MQCSICGLSLEANSDNGVEWNRHNAQPINDGTCCTDCNDNLVTPRRLMDRHNALQRFSDPTKQRFIGYDGHHQGSPEVFNFRGEGQHNDDD